MTNQQLAPCADAPDASIISMVHPRRPVKIVEHPAFRRGRRSLDHREHLDDHHAPLLAMAFRVVSLN